jgi:hypothetical protein
MQVNYNPNFGVLQVGASPRKSTRAAIDAMLRVVHAIFQQYF